MAFLKKILNDPAILIWLVLFVILIPILKPGFFSTHDETHIVDVYEMIRSLSIGFPVRWAPDLNFNLGYPYFNFYYHLPFYITSLFYFLGFSLTDSFKYMMGVAVILAGSGFYFFLRSYVGKIPAVIATLIYLLSPYFAVDLYVRGAFGELFIFALFPWAALFLKKLILDFNPKNLGLSSISIALLLLSHNVLLPFVLLLLLCFGIINLIILEKKFIDIFKIILSFGLAISLVSYYLLPAFFEIKYISSYEQFNIADHFPFLKQLIIPYWGYGVSIWGPLDDISFNIGLVNLIFVVLSLIFLKFARKEFRVLLIFFLTIFGIALALTNNRSLFFWESIRFLRLVQFPWRMLLILTISSSFISAIVLEIILEKYKGKITEIFLMLTLITTLSLNIWHYKPSEYKQVSDEGYLETYFASRTVKADGDRGYLSQKYLNFAEDFIPPTIWEKQRPKSLLTEVKLATGSGQINFQKNNLSYDINYNTDQDNKVLVAKAYFPGWEAFSDSQKLEVEPYSDYGIIAVPVLKGMGSFNLRFNNTPVRTIANSISAITAALILVLLIYPKIKRGLK